MQGSFEGPLTRLERGGESESESVCACVRKRERGVGRRSETKRIFHFLFYSIPANSNDCGKNFVFLGRIGRERERETKRERKKFCNCQ